jgi:glycerol-3-phosphate dehydrogenase
MIIFFILLIGAQLSGKPAEMYDEFMLPTRHELMDRLRSEPFDILVIGGGATGCGVALDAATRGLRVALVERDDFAAGSSGRSTKLVHGGVRYLEQAVWNRDVLQYNLVTDALTERAHFFHVAPHLTRRLPILTPIYKWWEVPYIFSGLKLYDWIAGKNSLGSSRYLTPSKASKRFPMLRTDGLKGAVIYYDGQFNDARMNVSLAVTAIQAGAVALNHVEATELHTARDRLTGQSFRVDARMIINATGPYSDAIRHKDRPGANDLIDPSSGVHVLLDKEICPSKTGLLIPHTRDGRLLFVLPWEGMTLAGTTDYAAEPTERPVPTEDEVSFIMDHLSEYFDKPLGKVHAAWSGLRPLVHQDGKDSMSTSRDHTVEVSKSGVITIAGGKWTTYRKMAEDAVDAAVRWGNLATSKSCDTKKRLLVGAKGYSKGLSVKLQGKYKLSPAVANHLARSYGSQAEHVLAMGSHDVILEGYPYIEAEVPYTMANEYACTAIDILARRMRLAFLNNEAARNALPRIVALMEPTDSDSELREAEAFLDTMIQ